jgi:hypothetical protein
MGGNGDRYVVSLRRACASMKVPYARLDFSRTGICGSMRFRRATRRRRLTHKFGQDLACTADWARNAGCTHKRTHTSCPHARSERVRRFARRVPDGCSGPKLQANGQVDRAKAPDRKPSTYMTKTHSSFSTGNRRTRGRCCVGIRSVGRCRGKACLPLGL